MQVDFSQPLITISGEPLYEDKEQSKSVLLKTICVNALLGVYDDDAKLSGEEKLRRYQLAGRLYKGGTCEVTTEEVVLLKQLSARAYPALVCGQAMLLLEGKVTA